MNFCGRKLESRPSREAAWEYVFWADLDAHAEALDCAAALAELGQVATMVRVLGTYPKAVSLPFHATRHDPRRSWMAWLVSE